MRSARWIPARGSGSPETRRDSGGRAHCPGCARGCARASCGAPGHNLNRQNIAREFKVSLECARFDSVKRRASVCTDMSGVTISEDSVKLMIDMDNDGKLSDFEVRTMNMSARGDVSIVPNGLVLPITVRFDQRGQAFINDCDPASVPTATIPLLYFCNGVCTPDTANADNSNVIFISPAGTVAMLYGGEGMPTFEEPTVTEVAADSNINPLLTVWNDAHGPSPSPSGSVSPTPTATAPIPTPTDPIPSPTGPTSTPTATPTPVPTPPACPTSAPWGSIPACTCMAPQTPRNNGMCK